MLKNRKAVLRHRFLYNWIANTWLRHFAMAGCFYIMARQAPEARW